MIRGDEIGAMSKGTNTAAGGRIGLQEAKMETETPESPQPEPNPPVVPEEQPMPGAPDEDEEGESEGEGEDPEVPAVSDEAAAEVEKQAEPMGQDVTPED